VFTGAPFGLKHVPSHVQRVLHTIFYDMPFVNPYIDNLIIASENLEEHREHIRLFIARCNQYNILLDPAKSKIACTSIKTLGNVLTANGIQADPKKVETVMNWPTPQNSAQLVSFLSFCNYLRGYVRHYADLAAPLDVLRNVNVKQFYWGSDQQIAFDQLKHAIAHAPALHFPDYTKPFAIAVDSSITGIGAVLYQPENPTDLPSVDNIITFASRSLKSYERAYSIYKLELNALIFGLRQFESAIYGRKFTVFTDHQALAFLHTQRDMNRTLRNWYSIIAEFDFDVIHLPGHINKLPDLLSRMYPDKWGVTNMQPELVKTFSINSLTDVFIQKSVLIHDISFIRRIRPHSDLHVHFDDEKSPIDVSSINSLSVLSDLSDPIFDPSSTGYLEQQGKRFSRNISAADCVKKPASDEQALQIVQDAHNHGHFGTRAVHRQLKRQGWLWPGMSGVIKKVVDACPSCQSWNVSNQSYHPLRSVTAQLPWDILHMDLITSFDGISLPTSISGYKYILIIVDTFTSFCILRPLKDKSAKSVAVALWDAIGLFGPPKVLQSDNGPEFVNEVVKAIVESHAFEHRTITAYVPRSAGKVESHVKISSTLIRKMMQQTGYEWHILLPCVQLFMNSKIKNLTNHSPFTLMFNRQLNVFQSYVDQKIEPFTDKDMEAWLESETKLHEQLFPRIKDRAMLLQGQSEENFNSRHRLKMKSLPVGALVMLRDVLRTNKNSPPYLGPYTVVRVSPLGHYTLRDSVGGLFHRDVPLDMLKPVATSEISNKPAADVEYYVDKILDHRVVQVELPNGRTTSLTQYLVKWSGYDEPTWEPYDNIVDRDLIRTYNASLKVPKSPSIQVLPDAAADLDADDNKEEVGPPLPGPRRSSRTRVKKIKQIHSLNCFRMLNPEFFSVYGVTWDSACNKIVPISLGDL
jgi:transposase InsO family protein